jgi:hypothetical protein
MSYALGFSYFYIAGGLATAMWLLREMRKQNEQARRGHEDWAVVAGVIIIATLWLPILLALIALGVAVVIFD